MNTKETGFSIELQSKKHLKKMNLANEKSECVVIEGTLGKLQQIRFDEDIVLVVIGSNGVLRIDLTEAELKAAGVKQ